MLGKGKPKDVLTAPWPPNTYCRVVRVGTLGRYCQLHPNHHSEVARSLNKHTNISLIAMEPLKGKAEG